MNTAIVSGAMQKLKHIFVVTSICVLWTPASWSHPIDAHAGNMIADEDENIKEAITNLRRINGEPVDSDPIKFALPPHKPVDDKEIKELTAVLNEHVNMQFGIAANDMVNGGIRKHDASITNFRGGADSGKPLGFYFKHRSIVYTSAYKDVSPDIIAVWSHDLHQFLSQNGSWYLKHDIGARFIPYVDKAQFANNFWEKHFKKLDSLTTEAHNRFLQESLLMAYSSTGSTKQANSS